MDDVNPERLAPVTAFVPMEPICHGTPFDAKSLLVQDITTISSFLMAAPLGATRCRPNAAQSRSAARGKRHHARPR
jgi:hypothetical protein